MSIVIKWPNPVTKQVATVVPRVVAAGLDFGWVPLALHVVAKVGPIWLVLDEVYQTHLSPVDVLYAVRHMHQKYGVERFWADPENPQMIASLSGAQLPIIPNQIKDLNYGLRTVYGLLKRVVDHPALGRGPCLRVNRDKCKWLIKEFGRYRWPQSRGEVVTGKVPIDRDNHALDALRYALVGEGEVPPEDNRVPLAEQPRMLLNDKGEWVDNPRAHMAQVAAHAPGNEDTWWDEGMGTGSRRFVDE